MSRYLITVLGSYMVFITRTTVYWVVSLYVRTGKNLKLHNNKR